MDARKLRLEVRRELKELRRPYGTLSEGLKEGLSQSPTTRREPSPSPQAGSRGLEIGD